MLVAGGDAIMRLGPSSTRPELLASLSQLYDVPRRDPAVATATPISRRRCASLERAPAAPRSGHRGLRLPRRHRVAAGRRPARARAPGAVRAGRRSRELALPAAGMLTLVDTETGRDLHVQSNSAALRDRYAAAARGAPRDDRPRGSASAGSEHLVLFTDSDWLIEIVRFVAGRKTLRRHASPLATPQRHARDPLEECSVSFEEPWRLVILVAPVALLVALRRRAASRAASTRCGSRASTCSRRWRRAARAGNATSRRRSCSPRCSALVFGFARPTGTKKVARQRGHDHARDRHVGFDGGDRRRAEPAGRGAGRGAPLHRRAARGPEGRAALVRHDRARARRADLRSRAGARRGRRARRSGAGPRPASRSTSALDAVAALPPGADGKKAPAAIVLMSDGSPTIGARRADARSRRVDRGHRRGEEGARCRSTRSRSGRRRARSRSRARRFRFPADPQTMAHDRVGERRQVVHRDDAATSSTRSTTRSARSSASTPCRTDLTEWFTGLGLLLAVLTAGAALVWMQRIP